MSDSKQTLNFAKISSSEIEDSYSLDDEDSISDVTLDDRILEVDDTGHVILTTTCQMIAPCVVVPGSLTITSTAFFFSVDEDDEEYDKIDPKVRTNSTLLIDKVFVKDTKINLVLCSIYFVKDVYFKYLHV